MLASLPEIYRSEMFHVLLEWNQRLNILSVGMLLKSRSENVFDVNDVQKNREKISSISYVPVRYYEEIAGMSPKKAGKILSKIGSDELLQKHFSDLNYAKLGDFSDIGRE